MPNSERLNVRISDNIWLNVKVRVNGKTQGQGKGQGQDTHQGRLHAVHFQANFTGRQRVGIYYLQARTNGGLSEHIY